MSVLGGPGIQHRKCQVSGQGWSAAQSSLQRLWFLSSSVGIFAVLRCVCAEQQALVLGQRYLDWARASEASF
eukprot:7953257-Lingulodinium_polyedra.AAC.1